MTQILVRMTVLILLLLISLMIAPTTVALADDNETDGYLDNGGFEGEFYPDGDDMVAEGWNRVHLQGGADWMGTCDFANAGPNCDQGWVERIGGMDSHILSVEDLGIGQPFETVLYQQVGGLTAGKVYSFSGWVLKMFGGSANQVPPSDPYSYGSWVGIDPTGGTDPGAGSVIWGEIEWQTEAHGHFENHRLAAVAQGSTMTVFVRIWLKWQRTETQAIVDAMELFDAPIATILTPSGAIAAPYLDWEGTLPQMLQDRGSYHLFYEVQKKEGAQWVTLLDDLESDDVSLPIPENEPVQLRVLPYSYQSGEPFTWPPSTHVGVPSEPVTVVLDTEAPSMQVETVDYWQPVAPVGVAWSGSDGSGSGVTSYDVEYRSVGESSWHPWIANTPDTSALFGAGDVPVTVEGGQEWQFRARAYDGAGQVSDWVESGIVALYDVLLTGKILGANGLPLLGAEISSTPYPFSVSPVVWADGSYHLRLPEQAPYTLHFRDASGNERLPSTTIELDTETYLHNWYLPPSESAVSNGHFEHAGEWTGAWSTAGPHTGEQAAAVAQSTSISQVVEVEAGDALSLMLHTQGASGPTLTVHLGSESWTVTPDSSHPGGNGWTFWHAPLNSTGTQTLTLTAEGGTIYLDEVSIGAPQPSAHHTYFATMAR